MAKGKGKSPGGAYIKNSHLIGAGTQFKAVKGAEGNTKFAESIRKQEAEKLAKQTPSPQVKQAQTTPKPAAKPISPTVNALKSTSSLTPAKKAMQAGKAPQVQKGAAELIASQKTVKPAVKSPAPVKKPPTPGR